MKKFKSFIALDLKSNTQNINIVKKLHRHFYGFKVGYRSFYHNPYVNRMWSRLDIYSMNSVELYNEQ